MAAKGNKLLWLPVLAFVLIVLASVPWALNTVVGWPQSGQEWGRPRSWNALGSLLQGLGAICLAVGTLIATVFAGHRFLQQRERNLRLRQTEVDLRLIRVHGELVQLLETAYQYSKEDAERTVLRSQLLETLDRYRALLDGILRLRPDLAALEADLLADQAGELRRALEDLEEAK